MSETEIQGLQAEATLLRAQADRKFAAQLARVIDEGDKLASRNTYVVAILFALAGAALVVATMDFAKYALVN